MGTREGDVKRAKSEQKTEKKIYKKQNPRNNPHCQNERNNLEIVHFNKKTKKNEKLVRNINWPLLRVLL